MKAIKFTLLAGALLATTGIAAAQPGAGGRGAAEVTRDQAVARADQRFARLDANQDGRLTVEEARQGNQARSARREARRADRQAQRQGQGQRHNRRFDRIDTNRDGQISREELAQRRAQRGARQGQAQRPGGGQGQGMLRLDTNNDGQISREEFAQRRALRGERRGQSAERGAQRAERRAQRAERRAGRQAERMFGQDGVITREEFRARALQRFERLDANHDGRVTMAERREVRQRLRAERRSRRQAQN